MIYQKVTQVMKNLELELNLQKNVFWCGKWMHKETKLGMPHKNFFLSGTQKGIYFLGIFLGC
jgi:hypothetical protein